MSKGLSAITTLKLTYGNAPYIYFDEKLGLLQPSTSTLKETIIPIIEKELEAVDIIKKLPNEEKQILLNAIYTYTKNEQYYDLLKEVLL